MPTLEQALHDVIYRRHDVRNQARFHYYATPRRLYRYWKRKRGG